MSHYRDDFWKPGENLEEHSQRRGVSRRDFVAWCTVGMWIILVFVPGHIYLSVLSGNVDREGTTSSMISGGRWLRRGVRFEDE